MGESVLGENVLGENIPGELELGEILLNPSRKENISELSEFISNLEKRQHF